MSPSSTPRSLSVMQNMQNVKTNAEEFIAKFMPSVTEPQPSPLGDMDLSAVVSELSNLPICSKGLCSGAEAEAKAQQDAFVMPRVRLVTKPSTPISLYWQKFTQEQSTALSRPHRYCAQTKIGHDDPAVKLSVLDYTAALEGRAHRYEIAYNRKAVPGENKVYDLMGEIEFLRKNLCSLLLQPLPKRGSHEQIRSQGSDAPRDVEPAIVAAEAKVNEQIIHEQGDTNTLDSRGSEYPMTTGHVEIQAVKEAVKEVSNGISSLKNIIKDLPSRSSQDQQTVLHNDLESVSQDILRFPDCLTFLLVRRKAGLDAASKDRDAAAETLRAAEETMLAAEAKETDVVAKAEAIDHARNLTEEKMKEATEVLMAVEAREKLVSGRERRVEGLEEEQVMEELNRGANAALEDAADAAAAEARENARLAGSSIGLIAPVENEKCPTDFETSNLPPEAEYVLPERNVAMAAKEEELWHRENNLTFRENNLHHRETTLFAREQLLEQMKTAQIQLAKNWKAQVDSSYACLEAGSKSLRTRFRPLIALKERVEEIQANVRSLIGEARQLVIASGGTEGEDKKA